MRQKIAALEDRLVESDSRRQETEEEFAKNRRLVKLLEKYKTELNDANAEIQGLKGKVAGCNDLQVGSNLLYMTRSVCLNRFGCVLRTNNWRLACNGTTVL